MNKIFATVAGVVFTIFFATSANAQVAGPNGGGVQNTAPGQQAKHPGGHTPIGRKMLKQLNLTPTQEGQIKALVQKYEAEAKAQQQNATPGVRPNRKEMLARRQQFMTDLMAILTPDQQTKLKQMIEEAKQKAKDKKLGIPQTTTPAPGTTTGGTKTGGGGGL